MKKQVLIFLVLFFSLFNQVLFAAEQVAESSSLLPDVPQIIGGYDAPVAYPWMTAILYSGVSDLFQAQYCGGVLIASNWVLTAGHCTEGKVAGDIQVAVGVYDLSNWNGTRIQVKSIVRHPAYSSFLLQNDLALLELSSASVLQPITIFSGASVQNIDPKLLNQLSTLIGWGVYDLPATYPSTLQQINLPVVADSYCNSTYGVTLLSSQLCAGYAAAANKDACSGDSGSPLMLMVDGQWVHVGLVSYGADCATSYGNYGVYTRSSAYVDFIKLYVPAAKFTAGATPLPITTNSKALPWLMLLLHKN
ncbi:MAG: serine protease [Desulfocapsaceae bacterium]|nr:serine protease [Desulfocapsaceae bacterium]